MPELLSGGLPARHRRTKFDFTQWADGRAWRFVKGIDYDSHTETFRAAAKKWATHNGFDVEFRAIPAVDDDGRPLPVTKTDPQALAVRFSRPPSGQGDPAHASARRP